MMRRALVPAIVLLLILVYVPGVGPSMTRITHSLAHFLDHTGRGVGDFLNKVSS
jgi:hypothetical protein